MSKDTLYIIDLDRTLIDVGKVMEVTKEICDESGVDFEKIYKDQRDLSKRGTAYSPFSYLSNHASVDIEKFKKRFVELSAKGRILFPDSQKLLDDLKSKKFDCIILTHGVDDDWQILKIQAANLTRVPYVIVENRYKSRHINGWTDKKKFINPDVSGLGKYRRCVFIDDRKEAFIDLQDNCQGYLLDRKGQFKPDVELPKGARIIKSLSEVKI